MSVCSLSPLVLESIGGTLEIDGLEKYLDDGTDRHPYEVVGTDSPILKLIAGILEITLAGRLQGGFILQN